MDKYKAENIFLKQGIANREIINNAVYAVQQCIQLAISTPFTFEQAVYAVAYMAGVQQGKDVCKCDCDSSPCI